MAVIISRDPGTNINSLDLSRAGFYDLLANTPITAVSSTTASGYHDGSFDGDTFNGGITLIGVGLQTGSMLHQNGSTYYSLTSGLITEIDIYTAPLDTAPIAIRMTGLTLDVPTFQAALNTYRFGHSPFDGDGHPNTSALDAIFDNLAYDVTWNAPVAAPFKFDGGNLDDTITGGLGNDVLNGAGGSDVINGGIGFDTLNGSDGADVLNGGAGNDRLHGGAGVDIMSGNAGDDWYFVDNAIDVVNETNEPGLDDEIYASVSYKLASGQHVEVLNTMGSATTTAINLTGNEFSNKLVGNAGANRLDGGGANDKMYGFGGNDIYFVDHRADGVFETIGNGTDEVYASISYALLPTEEIEVLNTMGSATTAAISLAGNQLANKIVGNAGANTLNGAAGNDTLYGFGGTDIFRFNTALNASTNVDRIMDFNVADDFIQLENAIFKAFAATGILNMDAFYVGTASHDASDRIIYNPSTGVLIYDNNGTGAGGAVQFATLTPHLALTNGDFLIM